MPFINETSVIGSALVSLNTDVTGSLFITLLLVLILFIAVTFALRIPLEYTAPLVIPLMLYYMAYTSQFLAIGGILLFFLAAIFAKNFFVKDI